MLFESLLIQLCQDQLITHLEDTQKSQSLRCCKRCNKLCGKKHKNLYIICKTHISGWEQCIHKNLSGTGVYKSKVFAIWFDHDRFILGRSSLNHLCLPLHSLPRARSSEREGPLEERFAHMNLYNKQQPLHLHTEQEARTPKLGLHTARGWQITPSLTKMIAT